MSPTRSPGRPQGGLHEVSATSAVLTGSLEAGRVRDERWFALGWPLQVLLGAGIAALCAALAVGLGP